MTVWVVAYSYYDDNYIEAAFFKETDAYAFIHSKAEVDRKLYYVKEPEAK